MPEPDELPDGFPFLWSFCIGVTVAALAGVGVRTTLPILAAVFGW